MRLNAGRRGGKCLVGGGGCADDQIEVVAGNTGLAQRLVGRLDAQVRRQFTLGGNVPLTNPGPLADPIVRGVDSRRQVLIGEDFCWQVGTAAGHLGTNRHPEAATYSAAGRWLSELQTIRVRSR